MAFLPLTSHSLQPALLSNSDSSSFSDADSEPVEDKIDRLTVLLQEVINLDKDAMTCTDWERMQIQIALNESNSDQLQISRSHEFSEVLEIADDYDDDYDYLEQDLDRALMRLEDLESREAERAVGHDAEFVVDEEELNYFLELMTQFAESFQGRLQTQLFYFGGKHLKVSIKGKNLRTIGHRLSMELSTNQQKSQESLESQIEEAFLSCKDSKVYVGDANCLEKLMDSIIELKDQLLDNIEQAKAVKNSYTRIKKRQSQASMEDLHKEIEMSRLQDLTSSPTPKSRRQPIQLPRPSTPLVLTQDSKIESNREKLEQELKALELQAKTEKKDVAQSAKIATRISRIKTELSRLRSEEAIQAAQKNSRKGMNMNYSVIMQRPNEKTKPTLSRGASLAMSFNSFDDDMVSTPVAKSELPSFSVDDISMEQGVPNYKPSFIAQQLRELSKEREEFEEQRLKIEADLAIQRNKLDTERKKLENDRKALESEMCTLQLQSLSKQAAKHSQIQLLCSEFLSKLDRIKS
mmetsp:Transcript_28874/g.51449  ORF Transcript_28874/g.51449 Transcript_28874/m.51449 type:complete len:522 (-) Transcript_28874:3140-4705(-)